MHKLYYYINKRVKCTVGP
uniref:Uncharacterized protein n=1 Tax=Arundo donax TaxID=35708 RepID=A0A0A8ZTL2_ARUDO